MNPNQEVRMYDFNEQLITVKMVTLIAWTVAYRSHVKRRLNVKNIRKIVRKALSVPRGYPDEFVLGHLEKTKAECHQLLAAQIAAVEEGQPNEQK